MFKLEIGDPKTKKTFHLEAEAEALSGRLIGEKVSGNEISPQLEGTEMEITGTSDSSGFPGYKKVEGAGKRRILLTRGFAFKKLKLRKKNVLRKPISKGMRKRRTVRGNVISSDTVQVNLKVTKQGSKSIAEMLGKEVKQEAAPAAAK